MRVTMNGQDVPTDVAVILVFADPPHITCRGPVKPQIIDFLRQFTGEPCEFVFYDDDDTKPYIIAHANLELRIVTGNNHPDGSVELTGTAWGRPPHYDKFFVDDIEA